MSNGTLTKTSLVELTVVIEYVTVTVMDKYFKKKRFDKLQREPRSRVIG